MSKAFFKELVEFLPKYVSPRTSYLHATISLIITFIVANIIITKMDFKFDIDRDGNESETEEKVARFIGYGFAFLIAIFVADLTFNTSFRMRNRVNRNHLTYARWFKNLYI